MKEDTGLPFDQWPADFRAKVYLVTPESGGRKTPARTGYRPQVWFEKEGLDNTCTSGSWQKMNKENLEPGESAEIEIALLNRELNRHKLSVGLTFKLTEGVTLIGKGEILEIFNESLRAGSQSNPDNPQHITESTNQQQ